jgi:tRNA nucleotidyltransferase (CCA-adding enzyme)
MEELLKKTIKRIRPVKMPEVDSTIKKINSVLKNARCVAGGSLAKKTNLRNDFDIDLFARFDYSLRKKDLSNLLEKALKKVFKKVERVHGSRDYFQVKNKITFEIVPVLNIKSYKKAENVTDMSPFHVEYVNKKLNSKLRNEIRLAKQFCKSIRVYGAESYIQGFSGHVLDLLILYYGSFVQLLEQASVWGNRVIIDVDKKLKDPMKELNESKTVSPLIVVDPIQPDRNAAAALSQEKFELFKKKSREFLQKPSEKYFKI